MVIWITGLSGAGKSSIARAVVAQLKDQQVSAVLLDGDRVRQAIADERVGFDPESRLINGLRICRLAQMLEEQGLWVVVATMSLYREVHEWNRRHLGQYFEVVVHVDWDVLKTRDARQIYSRGTTKHGNNVVGIHLDYDMPVDPDLVLTNNRPARKFDRFARRILKEVALRFSVALAPRSCE